MTCLYEGTMDDLIQAFMQVMNYKSWLKGGSTSKCYDLTSLKAKTISKCRDLMPMVVIMKSYPEVENLNTKDCALEGTKLFGSNKWKLHFPPGAECDSHQPNKVNYFILCPNTGGGGP